MKKFKEKVLHVVAEIPKGSVMSYAEVARKAGSPGAFRAVGSIMAKNVNPAIPCHRVVKSNGILGSYNTGGQKRKMMILRSEGVKVLDKGSYYMVG